MFSCKILSAVVFHYFEKQYREFKKYVKYFKLIVQPCASQDVNYYL